MTVKEINTEVKNNPAEFIKKCEDDFDKRVSSVVEYIKENDIKYIFVSGPTSSGKTTFSKRFASYFGVCKHIDISLDDYYKPLETMPVKKNGEYNFESVNSLRMNELKKDFVKMKNGEDVSIPLVDFMTGKHIENNSHIKISGDSVVVIEGLHALNPKIFEIFKGEKILKIFICPISLVERNGKIISSYDLRFIRRMVRDNNYRNSGAENSLRMWKSVRDGEKIYMNGYMKNSDVMINTFLNYEPCILKGEAIPLLEGVDNSSAYISKVKRLRSILRDFEIIDRKYVPEKSLLNEFIKKD